MAKAKKTGEAPAPKVDADQIKTVKAHLQQLAGDYLEGCGACSKKAKRTDEGRPCCGVYPADPRTPPGVVPPKGEESDDPYTRNLAARAAFSKVFNDRTTLHDSIWLPTWAGLGRPCELHEVATPPKPKKAKAKKAEAADAPASTDAAAATPS